MDSTLAPILTFIMMVELERAIILKLSQHLQFWKRYVNDNSCFVCNWYQEYVLSCLNKFFDSVKFTYEIEKET